MNKVESADSSGGIAIVGMAGRFPGAKNIEEYWQNLRDGVECVTFFSEQELEAEGIDAALLREQNYVRARAALEDIDLFDASFFGFTPREAELSDPQHRLFLECAWEALENAGYDSERYEGLIGVYAGVSWNTYFLSHLLGNRELLESAGMLQASIRNRTDHLSTKVTYKLNLKGPGVTVQTACSTSLVAVHLACQSLLNYQSDIMLAGGVSVGVPAKSGYLYQEGSINSSDGHCRAFDAEADGTVGGNGLGIVVLKRLEDALADGDQIYAVIKGSAINNDGSLKVGYTAPSIEGQAQVIAMAQAVAGVEPETISYIEAHGTGTPLGDPIEIAALTQVFRDSTDRKNFCAIGSVKTNIGHLDTAAGVAGLIKATLALKHREIPPSLNFKEPNPKCDFANSPFYVNAKLTEWQSRDGQPRRAGVSSFGIGGTNAHVVLEEAPAREASPETNTAGRHLLTLSAKTRSALEVVTVNLARHLKQHPELSIADVAATLQLGRRAFSHRRAVICEQTSDAIRSLETLDPTRVFSSKREATERPVVFMFPGQGAQYVQMARSLYQQQPLFRQLLDECSDFLLPLLSRDLRDIIYPAEENEEQSAQLLKQTAITQPALFVVEYALARLWMSWGVRPQAMIGHSLGEYVAACLSGVLQLEDALRLVAVRGRLMQAQPAGAMMAVGLSEAELRERIGEGLSIAAINGTQQCVVSGRSERVEELRERMQQEGVAWRMLETSHAFHSEMMEPVLEEYRREVEKVKKGKIGIPYISNLTGKWIEEEQARSAEYWTQQLRQAVRFGEGVEEFFRDGKWVLLEVGPGRTLMTLTRWHPRKAAGQILLASLPSAEQKQNEEAFLLNNLGQLWAEGVPVDWQGFQAGHERRRVALPTYPFERQRYWVEAPNKGTARTTHPVAAGRKKEIADWFYVPSWKRVAAPTSRAAEEAATRCLIFLDECGLGQRLGERLKERGCEVVSVAVGDSFTRHGEDSYQIDPARPEDYRSLLEELHAEERMPRRIIHLWSVTGDSPAGDDAARDTQLERSFYSLMFLAQAIGDLPSTNELQLDVVSDNMQDVTGREPVCPEKATLLGPCRVIPREYANISCRSIDLELPADSLALMRLVDRLIAEPFGEASENVISYRGEHRWVQTFEPARIEASDEMPRRLREGGVYLITGGLGGVGLALADYLAGAVKGKLVLTGRSEFPPKEEWNAWLAERGEQDEVSLKIKQLQAMEEKGAQLLVLRADASDEEQMRSVVARTVEAFGAINGVIHAAGVPGGGMIQIRTPQLSAAVLAPKVQGTRALEQTLAETKLDFFALCSSRSSILAGFGGTDYCSANAYLDAFAPYLSARRGVYTVSINWPAWQEVGMLVNTAKRARAMLNGQTSRTEAFDHPLLTQRVAEATGREAYISKLSVDTQWLLDEHRIQGNAVVPGAAYLELARAAFDKHTTDGRVLLEDVYFLTPLYLKDDEMSELRLVLEGNGDGYEFQVLSKLISHEGNGAGWQKHAIGKVRKLSSHTFEKQDLDRIKARCQQRRGRTQTEDDLRNDNLGPRWHTVREVCVGSNELLALIELPEEFSDDLTKLKLHPALIDRCVGLGIVYLGPMIPCLPLSYKVLKMNRPLARRVYAHIRGRGDVSNQQIITHDVRIMDEQGTVLVEIEGFSHKRINDASAGHRILTRSGALLAEIEPETTVEIKEEEEEASIEDVFQKRLQDGISPAEGVEVFRRLLEGNGSAQVIVSPKDFLQVIEEARSVSAAQVTQSIPEVRATRPVHARPDVQTAYVAPENERERVIAEIWQEIIGIERVGLHDNFFELGGDSVQAIQIVAKANKAGLPLTVQQLFQYPTVAEMAAIDALKPLPDTTSAGQEQMASADVSLVGMDEPEAARLLEEDEGIEDIYPLSHLQQGLLFHSLHGLTKGMYTEHFSLDFHGDFNVSAFVQAWQRVIERHQILRTSFVWENREEPLQIVHRRADVPLTLQDWSDLTAAEQQQRLKEYVAQLEQDGLELTRPPLLRVGLIQLAKDTYHFICSYHHILLDGWSINVLLNELYLFYEAGCRGEEPLLPGTRPYRDYIAWLRAQDLSAAESFWRQTLKGFRTPPLIGEPLGDENGAEAADDFGREQVVLSKETTEGLQELARQNQLTPYILVQGVWALLVGYHTRSTDVCFGTVVSGRPPTLTGVERIVGLFVNTLPVRVQLPADEMLLGWLKNLMEQQFELQQYEYSPLVQVRGWSEVPAGQTLFDTLLTFENLPVESVRQQGDSGLEVKNPVRYATKTNYTLSLVVEPHQELLLYIVYDRRRAASSFVTRLLAQSELLFRAILRDAEVTLGTLREVLREAEAEQRAGEQRKRRESKLKKFRTVEPRPVDMLTDRQSEQ